MDVTLLSSAVFDIPSSRRVGAIVHDGTTDMRLWPGPGFDREVAEHWGGGLQDALKAERAKLGRDLELGEVVRVHPGRLHCDMLLWIATRGPERGAERQPAPDAKTLEQGVHAALAFVASRSFERVAFPALGDGPGELDPAERLAIVVRSAHAYEERCFEAGRAPIVEEVLVCDARPRVISDTRRRVARLATSASPEPARPEPASKPRRRVAAASKRRTRRAATPRLDPDEVTRARVGSDPYDRSKTYVAGDYFVHPKFGVGRVETVTQEGHIEVLFEDGQRRKMLHAR